jgi:peptide/nickel transport system ATP-binding protein
MQSVIEKDAVSVEAPPVLRVEGLKAYYQMNYFGVRREVRAVDDVTLTIRRNEIYGIAGESSSGKSTLIKTIAGAITPPLRVVEGSVRFDFKGRELDVYAQRQDMKAARWKHLSYVMQGSMNVLNPVRKVKHAFHDFAFRHMGLSATGFRSRVESHLSRIGLDPRVLESYPHQLSGGMRQRLTIGLATVCEPEFIIADEPTTALDVLVQQDVLALIKGVQRRMGSSIIFVTHDMTVHAAIADRIGIVYAGRLVEEGKTVDVFQRPQHPYTAHLIASLPRIGDTRTRKALPGKPPNLAEPPSGCRFHPRCPLAIDKCKSENPPMVERNNGRVACWRAGEVEAA